MHRAYIAWQRAKDAATIVSSLLPTLGVSRVREVAVRGGPSFRIAQQGRNAGVGAVLWRSAPVLHQHMETQPTQFKDSTVLELGAGTGYVSFVASALGAAKVVATDAVAVEHPRRGAPTAAPNDHEPAGEESVLGTLRANAEMNPELRVLVHELGWGDREQTMAVAEHGPFTHIVGSDILYEPRAWPGLIASLEELASPETKVLIAYPERGNGAADEEFFEAARRHGFDMAEVHRDGMYAVAQMGKSH